MSTLITIEHHITGETAEINLADGQLPEGVARIAAIIKAPKIFKLIEQGKTVESFRINSLKDVKVKIEGSWMSI